MFLKLEDLEVYQLAEQLADDIWEIVMMWEKFARDTVGKQLVRSADSIPANISEGYGRYSFKENVQFCYFARGSQVETKNWLRRIRKRDLLSEDEASRLDDKLEVLGKKLNAYINSIKKQPSNKSGMSDNRKRETSGDR